MITLPFLALRLLFTRPRLFVLGTFPGIFTFAASTALTYLGWRYFLQDYTLWLAVPFMMMLFLCSWLLVGNVSLLPVEDAIADECQRAYWGEVRIPPRPMTFARVLRELGFSLVLVGVTLFFLLVGWIPVLGLVAFIVAGWMTAYAFLAPLYSRLAEAGRPRLFLFLRHGVGNFVLGTVINFLLFVPVLNVFLLGYAQVLASLYFLRRESPVNIARR